MATPPKKKPAATTTTSSGSTVAADVDVELAPVKKPGLKAGDVVKRTYFDHYAGAGGQDVTQRGLVVDVDDDGAHVAWLAVSDPLPVDDLTKV